MCFLKETNCDSFCSYILLCIPSRSKLLWYRIESATSPHCFISGHPRTRLISPLGVGLLSFPPSLHPGTAAQPDSQVCAFMAFWSDPCSLLFYYLFPELFASLSDDCDQLTTHFLKIPARCWEQPLEDCVHHWSMETKELLVSVLTLLGQVVGAEVVANPSRWSRALFWLYNKMEDLDWTVHFYLKPVWGEHFKNEVPSSLLTVCELPEQVRIPLGLA